MDYTISAATDGMFIILKVRGNITRSAAMQLNLEAHALGRKLHLRRYLVDVTEARNVDPPVQSYEFAHRDMQQMEGIDRLARVATLVSPGDHSHDFVETVTRNAGLNVKIFTDPDLAKQFLLAEESPKRTAADPDDDGRRRG